MERPPFYRTLYGQVLVATVAGVALGYFHPQAGAAMKPLGDGFIKLVRMVIAPIIFCTVVAGVAGVGDMKAVGKAGGLALVYFEVVTTLALVIGLVVVNVVRPGAGMNVDPATLDPGAVAQYVGAAGAQTMTEVLLGVIPATVVDAFAKGDILQVLLFSILFGFALHGLGDAGRTLFRFIDGLSRVLFAVVGIIMKTAPLGAFGAMAFTVGNFGVGTLAQLGLLMACFYATCVLFVAVVLNGIARLHGFSVWRFIKYIKEELFIVYGTSSSESALPRLMAKLENLGVRRSVVGLVIPAGYSFNLDGTAIYLTHRRRVHRPGDQYPARFAAPADAARRAPRHFERVRRRSRRGPHRSRGDHFGLGCHSGRGRRARPRHPSVHGRGDGGHESDWQRRRHDRGGEVVRSGG